MIPDDDYDFIGSSILARRDDYYRIALSFCGDRDDALDCVSEMTVIAVEKFGSLKNRDAFASWCTQILINQCRRRLRQRKRTVSLEDLASEPAAPPGDEELSVDLQTALSAIKPAYKEVIVLKAVLHYTCKEIAAMLRIPAATVQYRYDYGLKCLRRQLGGNYND